MFDINMFICVLYYVIVWRSSHSLNGEKNLKSHPRIHIKPFFIVFSFISVVSCNIEILTIFKKCDIALSKGSFYDIHIFTYSTMPITPLCSSLLRFLHILLDSCMMKCTWIVTYKIVCVNYSENVLMHFKINILRIFVSE